MKSKGRLKRLFLFVIGFIIFYIFGGMYLDKIIEEWNLVSIYFMDFFVIGFFMLIDLLLGFIYQWIMIGRPIGEESGFKQEDTRRYFFILRFFYFLLCKGNEKIDSISLEMKLNKKEKEKMKIKQGKQNGELSLHKYDTYKEK